MTDAILCATDFCDSSKEALKWSISVARNLNCHLTILHTYRLLRQNGEVLSIKKRMEEEGLRSFKLLEEEFLVGAGISYDFKSEIGFIDDRMEAYARIRKTNYLVISKSMTLANKELLGELMENLNVPLVIVP